MRIAIPYDNANIFQHFGKTENFKVYDVADGRITSAEVVPSNASGHGPMASRLAELGVDVVVCGGIGGGAQSALEALGIEICSGIDGDGDEAVASYLRGELVSAGVNCDHHGDGEDGGCHCGGGCGGDSGEGCGCGSDGDEGCGCGGGCGGCGGRTLQPIMEGINIMKKCRVHYKGTFNDGTPFDSSYDRGEPLEFVCGVGMMIRGFDAAVANMAVGESVDVHLMPEDAYGVADPNAIITVEISQVPGSEDLTVGQQVYLSNAMGQPFPVKVTQKDDTMITFDANHEMAGKELNFHIELVEISE